MMQTTTFSPNQNPRIRQSEPANGGLDTMFQVPPGRGFNCKNERVNETATTPKTTIERKHRLSNQIRKKLHRQLMANRNQTKAQKAPVFNYSKITLPNYMTATHGISCVRHTNESSPRFTPSLLIFPQRTKTTPMLLHLNSEDYYVTSSPGIKV